MTQVAKPSHYRLELQGLRAIGAFLVAIFHIWFGRVSGGVDVFFVVSGYLITGSLYKELQRSQTINVIAFWWRIAKRLAPLAYIVLAATWCAAWLWLPETMWGGFIKELRHSALSIENIKLMMNSVDYLERNSVPSAVQQFWALSIQVQFYAIWPFLLLACVVISRKIALGAAFYLSCIGVLLLASFAYSVLTTSSSPAPAYFDPFARLWEFALGGMAAIALPHLKIPASIRMPAGWIGLAAVISCGFVLPASAKFPGYVALWPTLGAVLILLSGGGGMRFGADRLLSAKPLAALGELSFGFYLWHWPVLVFVLLIRNKVQADLIDGAAVIVISLSLAYLTDRLLNKSLAGLSLENPAAMLRPSKAVVASIAALGLAVSWVSMTSIHEKRQHRDAADRNREQRNAALIPAEAARDAARNKKDKCNQNVKNPELITCTYGKQSEYSKTIALVGGSHSGHWLPALEKLAEENAWRIILATKNSCPLIEDERLDPSCKTWNEALLQRLAEVKPDAVFTTSTRPNGGRLNDDDSGDFNEKALEHVPDGYVIQWKRLGDIGVKVVAVRDNPWMKFNVPRCLDGVPSPGINCGRLRADVLSEVDPTSKLPPLPHVAFIDLTDQFCDETMCPPIKNDMIIYRDAHHLTSTYARGIAKELGLKMQQVRPDLFMGEPKS